uniref:Interleukin-17 receptor A-like n=1 Tax=Phallusia mammillata TaxID=59560 RepID=A0A6F9DFC3_9ASCI|nr:interleukin-17 receptor A-like [Phallusia mammillata]
MFSLIFCCFLISLFNSCHPQSCECPNNCSTTSTNLSGKTNHSISCSIVNDSRQCGNFTNIQVSPPLDLTVSGYVEEINSVRYAALKITWKPPQDVTITNLKAFQISLNCVKGQCTGSKNVFYCINNPLSFNKHARASFNYDCMCYRVHPGDVIEVIVASLPHMADTHAYNISKEYTIDCNKLQNGEASECLKVNVKSWCVDNEVKVEVKYHVPGFFTDRQLVVRGVIKDSQVLEAYKKYTIQDVDGKFPVYINQTKLDISKDIEFELSGIYKMRTQRDVAVLNISSCSVPLVVNEPKLLTPILAPVLVIVFFVIVSTIVAYFIIRKTCFPKFLKLCCPAWFVKRLNPSQFSANREDANQVTMRDDVGFKGGVDELSGPLKVLVTFVEDHPKHKDIVLKFAAYLHHDLGFEVILELWQQDEIYQDCASWIEKAIDQSDKWIVIWSPGARKRWDEFATSDCHKQDLFTPLLKKAKKDLFYDKNKDRYFFTYFDYCSSSDIPKVFCDLTFCRFKLMQDFKELYFGLYGQPLYQPGVKSVEKKVEFSTYAKPDVTKYGLGLKQAVSEMSKIAKENPEWYLYKPSPVLAPKNTEHEPISISDDFVCVNHMDIIPPSSPILDAGEFKYKSQSCNPLKVQENTSRDVKPDKNYDDFGESLEISGFISEEDFALQKIEEATQPKLEQCLSEVSPNKEIKSENKNVPTFSNPRFQQPNIGDIQDSVATEESFRSIEVSCLSDTDGNFTQNLTNMPGNVLHYIPAVTHDNRARQMSRDTKFRQQNGKTVCEHIDTEESFKSIEISGLSDMNSASARQVPAQKSVHFSDTRTQQHTEHEVVDSLDDVNLEMSCLSTVPTDLRDNQMRQQMPFTHPGRKLNDQQASAHTSEVSDSFRSIEISCLSDGSKSFPQKKPVQTNHLFPNPNPASKNQQLQVHSVADSNEDLNDSIQTIEISKDFISQSFNQGASPSSEIGPSIEISQYSGDFGPDSFTANHPASKTIEKFETTNQGVDLNKHVQWGKSDSFQSVEISQEYSESLSVQMLPSLHDADQKAPQHPRTLPSTSQPLDTNARNKETENLQPRRGFNFSFDPSINADSFHFRSDTSDFNQYVASEEVQPKVIIAPIDMENDPWKSLASLNKF